MKNAIGNLLKMGDKIGPFTADYSVEVKSINDSVEKAVIKITAKADEGKKGRSKIFVYGLSEGENLKLVRVENSIEIEVKVSTPLLNKGQGKIIDGIVVLQFQKNDVIASEFGVIVVGRTEMAVRKFLYRAPYAMDKKGNLAIDGIIFEPLKAEIKKQLARGIADALEVPYGLGNNPSKFIRGGLSNPEKMPVGHLIFIKDVNLLRGTATGVTKLKDEKSGDLVVREILIDLANFSNREEALSKLRTGGVVLAKDYHRLPETAQHYAKALRLYFPAPKKAKEEGEAKVKVEVKTETKTDAKAAKKTTAKKPDTEAKPKRTRIIKKAA